MKSVYVIRRPVVNEFLVREHDRRWRREALLVLITILPVVLALLLNIGAQFRLLETGYQIDRLERRLEELAEHQRQLRFESAYLAGPERVEKLAVEAGLRLPAAARTFAAEDLR